MGSRSDIVKSRCLGASERKPLLVIDNQKIQRSVVCLTALQSLGGDSMTTHTQIREAMWPSA